MLLVNIHVTLILSDFMLPERPLETKRNKLKEDHMPLVPDLVTSVLV